MLEHFTSASVFGRWIPQVGGWGLPAIANSLFSSNSRSSVALGLVKCLINCYSMLDIALSLCARVVARLSADRLNIFTKISIFMSQIVVTLPVKYPKFHTGMTLELISFLIPRVPREFKERISWLWYLIRGLVDSCGVFGVVHSFDISRGPSSKYI